MDDFVASIVEADVEEMLEVIVLVGTENDGDAINLVLFLKKKSLVAVKLDGFTDISHLFVVDSSFWLAITS